MLWGVWTLRIGHPNPLLITQHPAPSTRYPAGPAPPLCPLALIRKQRKRDMGMERRRRMGESHSIHGPPMRDERKSCVLSVCRKLSDLTLTAHIILWTQRPLTSRFPLCPFHSLSPPIFFFYYIFFSPSLLLNINCYTDTQLFVPKDITARRQIRWELCRII